MPFVKALPVSRIAAASLKSFTHGSLQTVVAATQPLQTDLVPGPLADCLLTKYRRADKRRVQQVQQHSHVDGSRQASTASVPRTRAETSHDHETGLERYFDAWQKHQLGQTKEWQQFQFARRLEWQPPSVVPVQARDATAAAQEEPVSVRAGVELAAPSLKRSYTTSALSDFNKVFVHDEAAEADALQQVNIAIAEGMQRSKDEAEGSITLKTSQISNAQEEQSSASEQQTISSHATADTPTGSFTSFTSQVDSYTTEILDLASNKQYDGIPSTFQSMLHAGVQQPPPAAYRALLTAAVELTPGKHQKVPKALEVYSDMLRRKVQPDAQTFGLLINLLATRAQEALKMRKQLEERLARYGGLEQEGKFMFRSSQAEYGMLLEDSSLSIAVKLFERAAHIGVIALPANACAALVIACAEQGRLEDMTAVYEAMQQSGAEPQSAVYPPMIAAFGTIGDLRSAVELYDQYKAIAIANNAGENAIDRVDNDVYAAIVKAYGFADRLKSGLKFLASVQAGTPSESELLELREIVGLQALLPLALKDETFKNAFELSSSLTGHAVTGSLAAIASAAADKNLPEVAQKAFDSLAKTTNDLAGPASAMLAMHIRNANVEAAEPYFRILDSAPAHLTLVEPTTMRAVALIGMGQAERGLRQACRMFGRIRDQQPESAMAEAVEQIDEALELLGGFMLKSQVPVAPVASVELLKMMAENGGLIAPIDAHILNRLGAQEIGRLSAADVEFVLRVQSDMILHEFSHDVVGPARFGFLLENIVGRSIMPSQGTETVIERTLINIDNPALSRLWNGYRYLQTPLSFAPAASFTPTMPYQTPAPPMAVHPVGFEDSYDPYAVRTDVKGSNAINDLLERPQGRQMQEALTKFRNMRRVGRVPRIFTYGKLIEAAAKESNLTLANDILEMAKQDVPFDARYRVLRFGWQQILDHMVAGCLTIGRRDLAARFHQDLTDMGAAPSANTFGLYITTLKENTKTFDEASEAVKVFLRAKAEGVEPSSFLYNALIGKLGKARRIDDCLFYFAEMRNLGIRPTSVTYGTIVNALCRVSDEKFAEEIFEEMESAVNYKPRPAPYHSLMQFFLTTKRDRSKVLAYYERMMSKGIEPTVHTYKLLIDTHATLEPVDLAAAEGILVSMKANGVEPEAVHYASLVHAKGCVLHDMDGARALFDSVTSEGRIGLQPCIYQAMFESLNANHAVAESEALLADMSQRGVEFTPYIANALIHGWTLEKNITKAEEAFARVPRSKREPSTYEAMVRAYLAAEQREVAKGVVRETLGRGYPSAVAGKIAELVR